MAFVEGNLYGVISGTTTIVTSPSAGSRRVVKNIYIYNADDVSHTITLSYYVSPTYTPFLKITLNPGDTLMESDIDVLDSTSETIVLSLDEAISSTNLSFKVAYADAS